MTDTAAPSEPDRRALPRDDAVTAYAIDHLYRALPHIVGNLVLMPLVIGFLFWDHVDHGRVLAWAAAVLATIAARWLLARVYLGLPAGRRDPRRWAGRFTLTSLASGLAWGYAGVAFFVPGEVSHLVILYVSIVGLAAGSIIVTSYWLPSFYAYALPSVGLSAVQLGLQEGLAYQGLGLLLLMYLVIIARVAKQQNRTALEAISLRFRNLDLVAQLREQKALAEQANLAKSRFLAAASHDLRQPLHALNLFVASLAPERTLAEQAETVQGIRRAVASLDGLFNALLDISRLDAGLLHPRVRDFRLAELVDAFAGEYRRQAEAKGLAFRIEVGDAVVRSDPALLETLLRNLLGNALRYTPSGRVELVAGPADDGRVRIEVRDTGIGIAPELHREIFTEYFQAANPERDRDKGLGLGLAIVDRLARLLGHGIEVASAPGEGSCFSVLAAAGTRPEPARPAPAGDEGGGELAGMRILVVDDEQLVRISMAALLGAWGCETLLAGDAEEALDEVERAGRAPDLVIADYRLREQRTGAEAVARLRRRWGEDLPALLITGDTAPERLREAQASGLPVMHKPVAPARLRVFLRQARAGAR